MDGRLQMAISNLTANCEAVLAARGYDSRIEGALWLNDHALAIPYPNVISLVADAQASASDRAELLSFLSTRPAGAVTGITDSFSDIELATDGFVKLFTSPWSVREAGLIDVPDVPDLSISEVRTADELRRFDRACVDGFGDSAADVIYTPAMLEDDRLRFYLGEVEAQPVAGVYTVNDGRSVGVYSLFTLETARRRGYAGAMLRTALNDQSDSPAITNPSAMSQRLFERLGFEHVGHRAVWLKRGVGDAS